VPVPPAELTVELTIGPEDDRAAQAGRQAATETGLALDAGPTTTALSGSRREVLDALRRVLDAALSAGASAIEAKLEVPARPAGTPDLFHVKRRRLEPTRPSRQPRSSPEPSSAASRSTRARSSRLSDSSSQVASTPSSAMATISSQR
jgi:uncharacterized protein YqgV (UPF0045/DUF77 family)